MCIVYIYSIHIYVTYNALHQSRRSVCHELYWTLSYNALHQSTRSVCLSQSRPFLVILILDSLQW